MKLFKDHDKVITINVEKDGESLGNYLYLKGISSRLFRRLLKNNYIFVNGEIGRKKTILKKGDIVSLVIEDEENNIVPENIPLDIIYEDSDLIILNKQPYMVVHPTKSHQRNTISNGLSYYFKSIGLKRRIRLVNRLDMNTSGILVIAKSSFSHHQVGIQFEHNEVDKKYLALVDGIVEEDEDIINLPIGREGEKSIKKTVTKEGKKAVTKYKVIERYNNATLLDVQIFTGKSHQIRVHLNYIGHPIIGDTLYFKASERIERQALHSYYLKFKLPRTKEIKEFIAPIPDDMNTLIEYLKLDDKDREL